MPKTKRIFPETLTLRLTVPQRTYLNDVAELHQLKPSQVVRGLIDSARGDRAINTLEEAWPA